MQGQEYLNQISASSKPIKTSKLNGIFSSKFFWIGVGTLIALIIIMIIGASLSGGKGGEKNNCIRLYLHLTNTIEVADTYQDNIKSSDLRGYSASLKGLLNNTLNSVGGYLEEAYNFKDKKIDEDLTAEADLQRDELDSELFEAKINGNLDRIYAHKMAREITIFIAEEDKIVSSSKSDKLKEELGSSRESLMTLYDSFNNYSETK